MSWRGAFPTVLPGERSFLLDLERCVSSIPYMSWYSIVRASRDILIRSIAIEQSKAPSSTFTLKTLNFAPGPLDTPIQKVLRAPETFSDTERAKVYQKMKAKGELIPPRTSARLLVGLLMNDRFPSGEHVDYYDIVGN